MTTTDTRRGFVCVPCGWSDFETYPLWRPLPETCQCPRCGGEAEQAISRGANDPALPARERAKLKWLLNDTTFEAGTPER